jgi:hypothetical protein
MSKTSKLIVILIISTFTLASVTTFKQANAQTIPSPTFSVETPNATYQVPTTYSTDPYTGANITNQGYTVNSINITFTIQNEPNTSFYLLQYKGHYSTEWRTLNKDGYNITTSVSSGLQTILTICGNNATNPITSATQISPPNQITFYYTNDWEINLALGSQMDFRLQAVSGSLHADPVYGANYQLAVGNISNWSKTQTITIPASSPSSSPSPIVPELSSLVIAPLLLSVFSVAVIVRHRQVKKV